MKAWAEDHPKARLMARKRNAILAAAQVHFLRDGYDGVSMEAIAATAEVSIMTLYRHAASKEDLFVAVIQSECTHSPEFMQAAAAEAMTNPLRDVLLRVGILFQEKLLRADTVALFRVVMNETTRFPQLAEAAYQEFVAAWEENLCRFLSVRSDMHMLPASSCRKLVAAFIDDLVGTEILRALLGLNSPNSELVTQRAELAADRFTAGLTSQAV